MFNGYQRSEIYRWVCFLTIKSSYCVTLSLCHHFDAGRVQNKHCFTAVLTSLKLLTRFQRESLHSVYRQTTGCLHCRLLSLLSPFHVGGRGCCFRNWVNISASASYQHKLSQRQNPLLRPKTQKICRRFICPSWQLDLWKDIDLLWIFKYNPLYQSDIT